MWLRPSPTTSFTENRPLAEALEREGAGWAAERCTAFAAALGGEPLEWGRLANENPPQLRTHDRFGDRIDEVEFHPAWHALLRTSRRARAALALVDGAERDGAHVARAALFYARLAGRGRARVPDLDDARSRAGAARAAPELAAEWEPLLTSLDYDFGLRPPAEKRGALCGMAMTERQGGSDVRANTTAARPIGGRRVRARRAQVVLLGADVRRVPRARAGAGRALLLPDAARAAGRDAQRLPHPAAEGQARRPLERVERDRARRGVGTARRRGGPRRPDDRRDGRAHAARLRARHGRRDARRRSSRRRTTRRTARPSASCSPTSR